ncbi:MAG: hypothetical protein HY342_04060 [Candidatus Lambdaproteobacteria bacterium]|nr:hypothetical protein [Candidatus Lambdaproteobacteria bacterium]
MKTMLMTAVRKPGDLVFEFKIFGYPGSQFPPIFVQATMREMAGWLRKMPRRHASAPAHDDMTERHGQ